jgi:hypothetical protein
MQAALEPRAEHKDATLARRAACGQRCWQAAVRLRQAKFRDFLEHGMTLRANRTGAIYAPAFAR